MRQLSRSEMKKVIGGYVDPGCEAESVICTACTADDQCGTGKVCRQSVSCIDPKVCARPYVC